MPKQIPSIIGKGAAQVSVTEDNEYWITPLVGAEVDEGGTKVEKYVPAHKGRGKCNIGDAVGLDQAVDAARSGTMPKGVVTKYPII